MTILIGEDTTTTIDATFAESWIIDTGVTVATDGLGIDASGAVSGRGFIIKGTLRSTSGPAMTLGDAGLADSESSIRIDHLGRFESGGAGLVAFSGGVTLTVAGDASQAGLVETASTALDFRAGGNEIDNDGTIRSTGGTAILLAGDADAVVNNGTIEALLDAIVSSGAGLDIENNGSLASTRGSAILSTGADVVIVNAGDISARDNAVSITGDGATVTNYATIVSSHGAGIFASGDSATILNTTTIRGATSGILSSGAGAAITNSGMIRSAGIGIKSTGKGAEIDTTAQLTGRVALVVGGNDSIATNLNEIHGTSKTEAAVRITAGGGAAFSNEGSVFARSGVVVEAGKGGDTVSNSGSLHGSVQLGAGDDVFESLLGAVDGKVVGGRGDDVYEAGVPLRIVEKAGEGTDTVKAMFSWTLGANIENLELLGDADADACGNRLANRLTGNEGDNRFWGLGGRDVFVIQTDGGADTIMDFRDGIDRIDFRGVTDIDGFSDLEAHMHQSGRNVVIDLTETDAALHLVIRKVDLGDLGTADFLF